MTRVLAFDTSGAFCAAALLCDGRLTERIDDMAKGQAEHLMPMLDEMLSQSGLKFTDLDAIGVGTGPGNFTGIRISVSAARGLALGLGKPAIGVSTLEALAYGAVRPVVAVSDARQNRVYLQTFGTTQVHAPVMVDRAPSILRSHAPAGTAVVGPVAQEIAPLCGWIATQTAFGRAEAIARIAVSRLDQPAEPPTPLYLRAADAAPARDQPPVILP